MTTATDTIEEFANKEYEYGFVTDIKADVVPRGLTEERVPAPVGIDPRPGATPWP